MSKKLIYLICFVLVLALVSTNVAFGQFVWEGRINKDSDDSEELDPSGAPEGSSGDLEMPYEDAGMGDKQLVGLRWEDVYVPKGARIVEAWLEFTVDETGEGDTFVSLIIEGELNPNPPTFTTTTQSEIADRQPRTTAKAIWEPEHWTAVGAAHQTSDISPVIEEIVNQDGWVSGNALVLIIRDNPANPSQGKRVADAGGGDAGVLLHIEYVTVFAEASAPSPADGATDVPRDVVLSWKPGDYVPPVNGHKVYLSESFDDVNAGIGGVTQSADSYAPAPRLDFNKTYYWRVDEVNGPPDYTVYEGSVWSFTTELFVYPIENITATASSQFNADTGPEKTINGSGLDDNDLHSTDETSMWLSSLTGPQPTWIQYEFDRVYKLHQMWVWNLNRVIEPIVGFGLKDVNIEYSTNGTDWAVLTDVPEFARAPGEDGYAHNTTVDLAGVPAKYVKLTANTNFGGLMPQYGLSEVRFFHIPVVAREPDPASGATDADVDGVLSWRAGREAATHKVYLSADEQAVIDETISPVSIPADRSYTNYATGELVLGQSYYWKVNEVNEAETPATWQGNVWNFSTQEYLVVDDFEGYTDFEPDRVFDTWVDGWGVPANGSQVGAAEPPFAEQTIVLSGKQSMPLIYDNRTASYSEATAKVADLAIRQDWTKCGIQKLVLYFHGDSTNSAEQLYVKLNGSKVIYDGDAVNLTQAWWQLWNIDLTSFGVNLSNVTELSIGLERIGAAGGMGVVYIDDIRLYRSAPAPPAPVTEWLIADDADDVEEAVASGSIDMTSGDLEMPYENTGQVNPQIIGLRFTAISIPKGSTITDAWVQFRVDEEKGGTEPVNLIIDGELSPDAAPFTSDAFNVSSRPRTTAQVQWSVPNWTSMGAPGPDQTTPSIASIIQEIVNQDGWLGGAIVLIFRDDPANPSLGVRCALAGPTAVLLHIDYQ